MERYGDLIIIRDTERRKQRSIIWECQCICGRSIYVTRKQLTSRHVKNCGYHETNRLLGKQFNCLTPLYYDKNSHSFECQCSCGKEHVKVTKYSLLNGRVKSCGHLKNKENMKRIDGVVLNYLTRKLANNNKSGYKGVFQLKNGLWQAKITLKGKQHNLGRFKTKAEAVAARKRGEERLFKPVLIKGGEYIESN